MWIKAQNVTRIMFAIKGKTLSRGVSADSFTFWILNIILCLKLPQCLGMKSKRIFFKKIFDENIHYFFPSFHRFPSQIQCGNFAQEWILIYASVLYKIVSFVLVPTSTRNYSVLDFVPFFCYCNSHSSRIKIN